MSWSPKDTVKILQDGLSINHRAKAQINCEYVMLGQILNSDIRHRMDGRFFEQSFYVKGVWVVRVKQG